YQGRPAVFGVVRDVTQEREAHELLEQRVAERTRELQTLLDMSRSISLMSALDPLLHEVFEQMRELVDYESVAIGLAEGDWYTTVAVRRDEIGWRSASPIGTRFAIDRDHVFWQALAAGRTLYTPNVAGNDDVARGFREIVGERIETTYAHVCSLLAAPLMVANELLGAVFLSSIQEDRYRPHDIGLIGAIASQIAVAVANTRLHEQARTVAALEERQKLARELHDSVSQALYGIGLGARTARTFLDRDPSKAVEPLDYVLSLAEAGMAEMRALIFELRPESLEQEGLVAALQKQAAATRARHALAVELSLPVIDPEMTIEMKETLYRIAQEAIHNTVKHARATGVTLRLEQIEDAIVLDVADNGVGFDSSGTVPGHLGLVSMQERVARLDGRVAIDSSPGQGTSVRVRLPQRAS
ncbi:MAG: GAF domain-containing sensor histidine kinase, partial [Thermomicrobiales bacterium]|nr:GAF domain-containing sensor histidine kinase [Thermomicrobiales bacterium]